MRRLLVLILLLLAAPHSPLAQPAPPDWAEGAVWYQLFPERFRNGDESNDPTWASLDFNDRADSSLWRPSDWTGDWYARDAWEEAMAPNFYEDGVFQRRYGGDLQGVLEKVDYLADLGVEVVYFNPVFHAASLHKYDASSLPPRRPVLRARPLWRPRAHGDRGPRRPRDVGLDERRLALPRRARRLPRQRRPRRPRRRVQPHRHALLGLPRCARQPAGQPLRRLVRGHRLGRPRHAGGRVRLERLVGLQASGGPRQHRRRHRPPPRRQGPHLRRDRALDGPERRRRPERTASTAGGWTWPKKCRPASGAIGTRASARSTRTRSPSPRSGRQRRTTSPKPASRARWATAPSASPSRSPSSTAGCLWRPSPTPSPRARGATPRPRATPSSRSPARTTPTASRR